MSATQACATWPIWAITSSSGPHAASDGISGRLLRDGEVVAATDTPEELTGEIVEIVRLTGELLAASGERLRAGEVVITGSVVPPFGLTPGQTIVAELPPLGSLSVTLS